MTVLVDTNILLRAADSAHKLHSVAVDAIAAALNRGDSLCVAPQVLYEFWVVATRPVSENGLGLTCADADALLNDLEQSFQVLVESASVLPTWRTLAKEFSVSGKSAHDARLVAIMLVHQIPAILTFNPAHFNRYPQIAVRSPEKSESQESARKPTP